MENNNETELPRSTEAFLTHNKIASICFVTGQNHPYCITCFYYFDKSSFALVFKSSKGTTHDSFIKPGAIISGTVLPDRVDFLKLQGIQFSAVLMNEDDLVLHNLKKKYGKKYLIGAAIPGYIWAARLTFTKFTDNSMGFGNKAIWQSSYALNESR